MKKLNWLRLKNYFKDAGITIFSTVDVINIFESTKRNVDVFLFNYVKKGELIRLKSGVFCLSDNKPSEFVIANRLCMPSYISLESALSFHGLIPEVVYGITSITTKRTREFVVNNINYSFNKIKRGAFVGYRLYKFKDDMVYIATPEKALADFLYFVGLGKKTYNDRIAKDKIDIIKLKEYLTLYGRKSLIKYVR